MNAASSPGPEHDYRFDCNGAAADAVCVALIRDKFSQWLRRGTNLGESRLCDVILAVNEALANTAEFAYIQGAEGAVALRAVHDPARRALTVTVSDRGRWRETNPLDLQRSRGRGIPLMRRLADSVIINTSGSGTSVCMRFDDIPDDLPVTMGAL